MPIRKQTKFIIVFLLLGACASKPKLYPNAHYKEVGKEAADKDINQCVADADSYLESDTGKKALRGAGTGAAIGAAAGGVLGLLSGNLVRGLAGGAAVGGAAGAASGALSPDQVKHNYVNQCLSDKGYRVIGWD